MQLDEVNLFSERGLSFGIRTSMDNPGWPRRKSRNMVPDSRPVGDNAHHKHLHLLTVEPCSERGNRIDSRFRTLFWKPMTCIFYHQGRYISGPMRSVGFRHQG